jgi:2-octaprenyl-6-methoxyphenol hydroxylase
MRAALDVLIRGGGPVGCTLALALRGSGLRVALAARRAGRAARDFRPIALSYASRLILERLGAWAALSPSPIEQIEVSQANRFGRTVLGAADAGVPALGYVVEYSALVGALESLLARCDTLREDADAAPEARCVAHAEGASSGASEKRYAQDAVVALVHGEPAAGARAFERFTAEGPLALLPIAGRYGVVWSTTPGRARELAAAPAAAFLAALRAACGGAAGAPRGVEARSVQPLVLRVRPARVEHRAVFLGNAAQTLHPVAGQGLNLGLRDAWELAQVWHGARDPGEAQVLERYAARRRLDAQATVGVTDLLAGAFLGAGRAAGAARGLAMTALDVVPPARRFFARRMIFGPFAIP